MPYIKIGITLFNFSAQPIKDKVIQPFNNKVNKDKNMLLNNECKNKHKYLIITKYPSDS